jgi:protocatechuate 3,4-dioxygenase beta subunit
MGTHDDDHDLGLPHDLGKLLSRRTALALISSAATGIAGCDYLPFFNRAEAEVIGKSANGSECVAHPRETAGPFPADGSNRAHGTLANVLSDSGIVRQDMRTNLGNSGKAADGVALTLTVNLVDVGRSCAPLQDHAVYLWHCDAAGKYSIYELREATYLRAVSVSDARGQATFTTIVPGCYMGRFPHIHVEVYPSLGKATDYRNRVLTSQLAIPADVCKAVYNSAPAYKASIAAFARSPLERDGIFMDNTAKQLAAQTLAMTKEPDGSYRGSVTIGLQVTA